MGSRSTLGTFAPVVLLSMSPACDGPVGDPSGQLVELDASGEQIEPDLDAPRVDDDTTQQRPTACGGPPKPQVGLSWVDAEGKTFSQTKLSDAAATLQIVNDHDERVVVELGAVGGRGTTATVRVDVPAVVLDPGQSKAVEVPLERFLAGDAPFSREAHVSAVVRSQADGHELEKVISNQLGFHDDPDQGLLAYDDQTRIDEYAGGDLRGRVVADADDDGLVEGVVRWEPPADGPGLEFLSRPASTTAAHVPPFPIGTAPQYAYLHYLCVDLKIETFDSGYDNSQGIEEDIWPDANDPVTKPAHGGKVKVNGVRYDLGTDGCVGLFHSQSEFVADVKVYSRSTLPDGTYVRLHTGPADTTASFPGKEFTRTATDVAFDSDGPPSVVQVGQYNARWTAMAALGKSLHRYGDGLAAGTEIHANDQYGCDSSPSCNPNTEYCCDCSLNQVYGADFSNNESYVRFTAASCSGTSLRAKFVVGHEYGHAYGAQIAEKAAIVDGTHQALPSTCPFENDGAWNDPESYDNDTKEWSSLALHEGWAHYVSARVWNNKANDGQFRWGESFDLERWDPGNTHGGYLATCCDTTTQSCADSLNGTGTIPDWMRGLWDLHTDNCSDAPNREEMAELYGDIIGHGFFTDTTAFPLAQYYTDLNHPTCGDDWEQIACHNGLDEIGVVQPNTCD